MNVGLVQVDGSYPNLALMQVSAYHELRGDRVEWYRGGLFNGEYDRVYASKIFDFSPMPELPEGALIGGTGIDWQNQLPPEIAECEPSYLLYPNCDYHIGFSMKGCRFRCKFCCVPQKEGRPKINSTIDALLTNPNGGNRLMLLDNDFFGGPEWRPNLERIIELKLKVCFLQGLNIRIITDEQAALLAKSRYYARNWKARYLTFAWDRYNDGKIVKAGIDRCVASGIPTQHMQFFVLIGFDTTHEQNMERVMTLHEMGAMPFVMPYDRSDPYQRSFSRWVNHRSTFKSTTWKDYKWRRDPQPPTRPVLPTLEIVNPS